MAIFKLMTLETEANPVEEIEDYKNGMVAILRRLSVKMLRLGYEEYCKAVNEMILDQSIFDPNQLNIQNYPRLWSESNRIGKSDIAIENSPKNISSTYETVKKVLIEQLSELSYFKLKQLSYHPANCIFCNRLGILANAEKLL